MNQQLWIEHLRYLLSLSRNGRNKRADWKEFKQVIKQFGYKKGRKLTPAQKARKKMLFEKNLKKSSNEDTDMTSMYDE